MLFFLFYGHDISEQTILYILFVNSKMLGYS